MVHKLHALACDELNRNLAIAWQAVDQLLPARDGPSLIAVTGSEDESDDDEVSVPTTTQSGSIPRALPLIHIRRRRRKRGLASGGASISKKAIRAHY